MLLRAKLTRDLFMATGRFRIPGFICSVIGEYLSVQLERYAAGLALRHSQYGLADQPQLGVGQYTFCAAFIAITAIAQAAERDIGQ